MATPPDFSKLEFDIQNHIERTSMRDMYTTQLMAQPQPPSMQDMLKDLYVQLDKAAKNGDTMGAEKLLITGANAGLLKKYAASESAYMNGIEIKVSPVAGPDEVFVMDKYAIMRNDHMWPRRSAELSAEDIRNVGYPVEPAKPNYSTFKDDNGGGANGADVELDAFSLQHVQNVCMRANVPLNPENKRIAAYAVGMSLDLLLRHLNEADTTTGDELIEEFRYMLEAFATEHGFPRFDAWKK